MRRRGRIVAVALAILALAVAGLRVGLHRRLTLGPGDRRSGELLDWLRTEHEITQQSLEEYARSIGAKVEQQTFEGSHGPDRRVLNVETARISCTYGVVYYDVAAPLQAAVRCDSREWFEPLADILRVDRDFLLSEGNLTEACDWVVDGAAHGFTTSYPLLVRGLVGPEPRIEPFGACIRQ